MITHFQFHETKGKDYFRKAWNFSFIMKGQLVNGIYHQDGMIEWGEHHFSVTDEENVELTKELHRLMGHHVFR